MLRSLCKVNYNWYAYTEKKAKIELMMTYVHGISKQNRYSIVDQKQGHGTHNSIHYSRRKASICR